MSFFGKKKEYNSTTLENKLLSQLGRNRLPNTRQLKYLKKFLSLKEKWLLASSLLILVICSAFLINNFWTSHLVIGPKDGGDYIEGTLSAPSHINPLFFGSNPTDDDLVKLIYSSLWKRDENGALKQDLVEKLEVSDDQKNYLITITDKARWHSGEKLTVDDIIFTINTIKDARFKSPWRRYLISVEAEKISDTTVKLSIKEPYSLFLEYLTFGILPKRLWQDISPDNINLAELNIKPVGSGPFKFKSLTKDKSGSLRSFNLVANKNYYQEASHLNTFSFKIFNSPEEMVDSLNDNTISGANYLPNDYQKSILATNAYNFNQLKKPEALNIFFNLKKAGPTADKKVREALAYAINKEDLLKQVYGNNLELADSPIASFAFAYKQADNNYSFNQAKAKELLASANWKEVSTNSSSLPILQKNGQALKISLTTINSDDNIKLAQLLAASWLAIGVQTEIIPAERNTFFNQVIKPKNYNLLLYSILNTVNSDPYPFWHSSQSDDKGYNLSNYNSTKVDRLLEEARLDSNIQKRAANYAEFQKLINNDLPAIFLANQNFVYIQSKKVKGFNTTTISSPEDRLSGVTNWYLTEKKTLKL